MRIRFLLSNAAILFSAFSPVFVRAQFQPPNPDELKMTADPKAPGADAVFLEIRESDNDPMHYRRYYARIKVLTEKGKDLANIDISYMTGNADFKIVDVNGRTIHPDGTVVPLTVKPDDLLVEKTGVLQIKRKVFTLPDVQVGSILEYSYALSYDNRHFSSPVWEVQRPYFVHQAHYDFTPFQGFSPGARDVPNVYLVDSSGNTLDHLVWWWRLPNGMTVAQDPGLGRYKLDVTDISPTPDEAWEPPDSSMVYKVQFYYTFAKSAEDFWKKAAGGWSKEADHFAGTPNAIREAVNGLIAPADTDLEKAQKLYAAVQSLDNTGYSRAKSESERRELGLKQVKSAEDTWKQKSGNSEDMALLYLAMLRAAGLTAYAFKVVDRSQGVFDPSYMSLDQLDDTLVILSTGSKEILLDPGQKMCPFQTVSWKNSGAEGLRQSANGPARAVTPYQAYGTNTVHRGGEIDVDEHGGVTGNIEIAMDGQQALFWRQEALEFDESELKKQFDRELEAMVPAGVEAHVDHFVALDQPDSKLTAEVKVTGTLGTATGKRLVLPGFLFETRESEAFISEEKRQQTVDMHFADQVNDQLTYDLPPGMTVEGAPPEAKVSWENHAIYIVKTRSEPGRFTVARAVARAFTLAKPEEYGDLRGFYQKVASADQEQLVLSAAETGKGN
jgi:Domain of Unknown Function with PDB structure (DUF3857)/Transglutaminase-like superfamily